jgi:hypothetical protein
MQAIGVALPFRQAPSLCRLNSNAIEAPDLNLVRRVGRRSPSLNRARVLAEARAAGKICLSVSSTRMETANEPSRCPGFANRVARNPDRFRSNSLHEICSALNVLLTGVFALRARVVFNDRTQEIHHG